MGKIELLFLFRSRRFSLDNSATDNPVSYTHLTLPTT